MSESDRITLEDEHCPECQHWGRWFDPDRGERGCPNCDHVSRRTATMSFLRNRINQQSHVRNNALTSVVDSILGYEANSDDEFGCCHDPVDIEFGECQRIDPDAVPALHSLVTLLQK